MTPEHAGLISGMEMAKLAADLAAKLDPHRTALTHVAGMLRKAHGAPRQFSADHVNELKGRAVRLGTKIDEIRRQHLKSKGQIL